MATVSIKGYGGARRQATRINRINHHHRPGWVHIMCNIPPLNHRVRLGPDGWKPADIAGGWDATQRPRAVGMTTWSGVPPMEGDLSLLYDDPNGVEQQIQQLIDVTRGTDKAVPGIVWLDGIASLPADRWVIGTLSVPGDPDKVIRNRGMERIRQSVVLHLIEYMPPQYETLRKNALAKARPKTVIYKVKKGDTPAKIARNRHCRWTVLKALNKKGVIKTANQHLKQGIQIMVPVLPAVPKKKAKK
jgi:LysM domain